MRYSLGIVATLLLLSAPTLAETSTLRAAMSWSGHGRIFQIAPDRQEFLGMIEGVLYVETAAGELDEAFMECTVKQQIHQGEQRTTASGNCVIVQGPEDNVYAEYECQGNVGACRGELRLTSGNGRFDGISGKGEMIIRSPLRHLTEEYTDAENLHVDNGIVLLPRLEFQLKGGKR